MTMNERDFQAIEQLLTERGFEDGFDELARKFIAEKNYPALFETRLMRKRIELGLPAVQTGPLNDLAQEARQAYEQAQIEAARETGSLFLDDGQIYRAWPYFRALGEPRRIADAIEQAQPSDEEVDGLVEIAFHEGVHPRRGFELILKHYGTCRAITNFNHYPNDEGREQSARMLVDDLYGDLLANIQRAIAQVEGADGQAPQTLREAIESRDWLFDGHNYYIDTSHVASIVQMSVDWMDRDTLAKIVELTEYGQGLAEMYQFKGEAPFENVYQDTGIYLRAVLGENVDEAIEHFRAKLPAEPDPYGAPAAQALVKLLVRLDRLPEALDVAAEHLQAVDPQYIQCPSAVELCQRIGDYARLAELARANGDVLTYAAAVEMQRRG